MNYKTFLASLAIAGTLGTPFFAFAQESTLVSPEPSEVIARPANEEVVLDPKEILQKELAELKAKESDPTTGFVTRFFIRIKIKELENKLNIATALK